MPKLSGRKNRGLTKSSTGLTKSSGGLVKPLQLEDKKPAKKRDVFKTLFSESVGRYRQLLLNGRVVVMDPSSGSRESMPGYAVAVGGKLAEAGTIRLPLEAELHVRLQALRKCLTTQFDNPDVLVVENLPPFVNGFNKSILSLHKSVGVIIASFDCHALVEVAPSMWHKFEPENGYHKSDVNDAIIMLYVTLREAYTQSGQAIPASLEEMREKTRGPNG